MSGKTVNGSGNGARSGAQTLVLLAAPLNVLILRALAAGPMQQIELRRKAGSPAQTTLRAQLQHLAQIGAISKQRRNRFPGILEYDLTAAGRDLLFVAEVLERWLRESPEGPLPLGENAAKAAIKALAEGWTTTMVRALAARPLSLTELDRVIGSLSYPSLERRLGSMRLAALVEAQASNGRGTPYAVTPWLRRGVAPLAVAARWERRHLPEATPPIGRLDVEAAFLLTTPMLRISAELSGSCRLAVQLTNGKRQRLAGVTVEVQSGRPVSSSTQLQGSPDAWALGSPGAWLRVLIDGSGNELELGGDCGLARSLLDALHESLFVARLRPNQVRSLT